eukprot:2830779-Prymnesium_polylepis.1
MKVLREKVHCRSSSSINIDYNQPLVGGLSVRSTPARQIHNLSLPGETTVYRSYLGLGGVGACTPVREVVSFSSCSHLTRRKPRICIIRALKARGGAKLNQHGTRQLLFIAAARGEG